MVSELYPVLVSQAQRTSRDHLSSFHSRHSEVVASLSDPHPQRRNTRPREPDGCLLGLEVKVSLQSQCHR